MVPIDVVTLRLCDLYFTNHNRCRILDDNKHVSGIKATRRYWIRAYRGLADFLTMREAFYMVLRVNS